MARDTECITCGAGVTDRTFVRRRQEHTVEGHRGSDGARGELDGRGGRSLKTLPYDPAEFLDDETAMADYLRITCEDGSPAEIARALGAIARARGMTEIAAKTGITRPALYKALSGEGNPELATVAKVAEALGFRLTFEPLAKPRDGAAA